MSNSSLLPAKQGDKDKENIRKTDYNTTHPSLEFLDSGQTEKSSIIRKRYSKHCAGQQIMFEPGSANERDNPG